MVLYYTCTRAACFERDALSPDMDNSVSLSPAGVEASESKRDRPAYQRACSIRKLINIWRLKLSAINWDITTFLASLDSDCHFRWNAAGFECAWRRTVKNLRWSPRTAVHRKARLSSLPTTHERWLQLEDFETLK